MIGRAAARGALTGSAAGAAFAAFAGLAYVAANSDVALPWEWLAPAFAAYAILSGAMLGASIAGAIALLDAVAARRTALAPIPAALLAGAIAGILPGAFAIGGFGSLSAPFMGGPVIFAMPFGAATLVAAALAVQDRGAGGREHRIAACVIVALAVAVVLGGVGWLVATRIGDHQLLASGRALSRSLSAQPGARDGSMSGLVYLGSLGGVAIGALLGLYVGAVIATSRLLR